MIRGPADGTHDVLVPGAAAHLTGDRGADLLLAGIRIMVKQPAAGHQHAGRAEAALEAVTVQEALLYRVQRTVPAPVLNRADCTAIRHRGQHRARLHRLPAQPDHAGTAIRRVAAPVA